MMRNAKIELMYMFRTLKRGLPSYAIIILIPLVVIFYCYYPIFNKQAFPFRYVYILPIFLRIFLISFPGLYSLVILYFLISERFETHSRSNVLIPISIDNLALSRLLASLWFYLISMAFYVLLFWAFELSINLFPPTHRWILEISRDDLYPVQFGWVDTLTNAKSHLLVPGFTILFFLTFLFKSLNEKTGMLLAILLFSFIAAWVSVKMYYYPQHNDFVDAVHRLLYRNWSTINVPLITGFIFCLAFYWSFTRRKSYL